MEYKYLHRYYAKKIFAQKYPHIYAQTHSCIYTRCPLQSAATLLKLPNGFSYSYKNNTLV